MCQINKYFLSLSFLFISFYAFSQQSYTISGYVKDAKTGEELLGVTVYVEEIKNGVVSNPYGFYSLTLKEGEYNITLSFIGYEPLKKQITLNENLSLNLKLTESSTELEEVVVEAEAEDHNVQDLSIGKSEINIVQVKNLPALFGEPDIIKTVQMQPGVLTAGEGTSAFFVRGGSADQNMILLDEAPVYDPSHFFGLFSVFNADVIKSSELYRGGIPAQYGGRLSSLLDIRTKDGNANKLSGAGSIGLLASKFMLEGPIAKNKSSFIVSARRSYADVVAKAVGQNIPVYFYDFNGKINWKPNNKNRFFLAAYLGRDVINFNDGGIGWGNKTTTFRWNHLFNERLFSNTTFAFSDFDYKLFLDDDVQGFEWTANMQEATLKKDLTYFLNPSNEISFGASATYRRFSPGRIEPKGEHSIFANVQLDKQYAMDYALYLGNTQKISDRFSLQYGLRYSIFQSVGDQEVKIYEDPTDNVNINIIEIKKYDQFEPIKTFHNLEPRFSARYTLNESSSLKASYQRMVQNIHLIANSTVPIPFNTWAPSGMYLKPQKADQVAIGYFRNFDNNTYEFSVETYYKEMKNVTDFADNAQVFFNEDLPTEYRQGTSDSYGLEFNLKKNEGRLTGFASYTWSKTNREVPDVNNNEPFLANYDRRHSFNLAATYQLDQYYTFGANFVYYTGRPITLPTGRYEFDGYNMDLISERNGYKLEDFHRLDISVTKEGKKNNSRKWKTSQSLGIYNVYNRRNPFTIYSRTKQDDDGEIIGDGSEKELRKVSLFPILLSYSWRVRF
ncbi:TonB-dependent receptor [Chondrinema litorale]|uniref:TonB-dependent receptor n=1 Tax=Chondrinema litorale TaxID=2994555 RepID=UPI002542EA39|nr:TonB-dependent receptor [Chondrinema litorale]UZR93543.1 TonB-dependent receptor [Chondrinema litorale]